MATTPVPKGSAKAKPNKTVVLRLAPHLLKKFSPLSEDISEPSPTASPAPASTPIINAPAPDASEANGTPAPGNDAAATDNNSLAPPPATNGKRKGVPGPKPGTKRTAAQAEAGPNAKPRGKPGPKKKPRLADGTIDRTADGTKKGPFGGVAPIATHKLGPKANTGAINAGLRALDRSGKPCRRWERKGIQLKSISGVAWTVGSWAAPLKDNSSFSGDVKSENSSSSNAEHARLESRSSVIPSERSNAGEGAKQENALESSPAAAPAIEA
ncbi:hypothetical protein AUEXF2481DRAFT_334636 [Aureobasidium subglaciale EXF-2481]|uniref:INO80 complex subunit Ies4 n=1 Tax=Aureobasidium subglaciale (strain EXF-2481) TaxID=1043005 RepID=A0A074YGR7_AURSE|nr:uncharacterized protein AUEXF2481DRAFT_334636 [Aureobasidium subglaciale EXF-2481]KAI5199800.1 hypothetical protein E4T38_06848 [Aureobasidium subglaciale]KAI5218733.1 hypothetical protein E4T40_06742 [Aureobasidium subglaciale]KAI5222341.1 hypothetical protein E4T41_06699 [Aureobasidium subglaciale]KAI5259835.1 hypothetical protein E4T46_06548 [Aureobasidium subglaciale]KEQ93282.1 hypothetical protein AUEXF2481DRAFT_334636 [Aureobasidium subglaciale EXF-2481]